MIVSNSHTWVPIPLSFSHLAPKSSALAAIQQKFVFTTCNSILFVVYFSSLVFLDTILGMNRDCKPCRSQNYSAVALDDSIPPAVEDYFCDPLDHLKKYIKVHDFQRGHRDKLSKHLTAQVLIC